MAKLCLKFENTTLKEFSLTLGVSTIGRLPDNDIQIDNPAVSGHHAAVFFEGGDFVIEDKASFNGTFLNDQRITRHVLRDNDSILIGKHSLLFKAEPQHAVAPAIASTSAKPQLPSLDATAMLDTKKARELMAQAAAKAGAAGQSVAAAAPAPKVQVGMLNVLSGKTDQRSYLLTSKLTVIGKSEMASIRLKGWFAPSVAGTISRRQDKYFIAPSDTGRKIKVNGAAIAGQCELSHGDRIAIGKVTMSFAYNS